MRAELFSGEIVTLPKECNCITHNEPHWVHMWRMSRDMTCARANDYLAKMEAIEGRAVDGKAASSKDFFDYEILKLAFHQAAGEMARIYGDAIRDFQQRGIVRLIEEESDKLTEIDRQRIRDRVKSMLPPEPEITPYLNEETKVRRKAKEML